MSDLNRELGLPEWMRNALEELRKRPDLVQEELTLFIDDDFTEPPDYEE